MPYLTESDAIRNAIDHFGHFPILWLDTEVADYDSKTPRLSLIQILADSTDLTGERVTILDVLDRPDLTNYFITKIMLVDRIEKVFHNASYDCKFLGGKSKVKKITCTLELAKKVPYYIAPLPNYQLKTVAECLCHFPAIDKSEQGGNWGKRPLTAAQLEYAQKDPVYTAQIHHRLLQLSHLITPDPAGENLERLTNRYWEIYQQWRILDTEMEHLKERLKSAIIQQEAAEINGFSVSYQNRTSKKVKLAELAKVVYLSGQDSQISLSLTNDLLKELGDLAQGLTIEETRQKISQLTIKQSEADLT
ncbi:ribonuclease D [Microcystis sp. LSC13-02]|jgi:ribonuclease D|uniref:ribonuclease D n=1 Tax=Microcystis sp. LSC13-02 TaxID=1895004 RepID=UPI00257AD3D9|nr:ribonuclease D [Microcystis sp. LSC13-02]